MYHNYHRHDHYSNVRTPDTITKPMHYIERAKELGHTHYFTTNHGCSGDVFEAYELCKKNDLTCVYGMEMYYTDDRFNKCAETAKSYHIIVIGLTKNAYHHINRVSSLANTEGFYYKPRVDLELLLSLPMEEVVITTACIAGRLFQEGYLEHFVKPLQSHFKDNFMLEVQSHNQEMQINWNKGVLAVAEEYSIPIIHGCDSHFIYPSQSSDRMDFIRGKGINYGDEDSFMLDYPDYQTILDRYEKQGVLSKEQAIQSLKNTLIFDKAEDLKFTKEVKMPTIYPELTVDERFNKLANIVKDKLRIKLKDIPKERHKEYVDAVKFELDIIKETNLKDVRTADYFLINERIINKGVNEYGGVLTKTGRGSATSFIVNNLLGFTEIDRLDAEVPLYPTRFMSKSRILEAKSLPDIDFNTSAPEPFIQASKDVLGEDGCYYMIAYGTLKMSGAFRMMCRAQNLQMNQYNDFGKKVGDVEKIKDKKDKKMEYDALLRDDMFGEILKDSEKFVGVVDSIAPSPCSFLLLDKPISTEVGLIKIKDEICCMVDGSTAENYKFLKNDILTVTVWKIIADVYEQLNKPIPSVKELREKLDDDVWNLYEDGITKTLNQADSDFAIPLVMKYSPRNAGELTAWVAGIRPSFASLLNGFLNREDYSTGTPELDELLTDSFHYLLYQENIMQYLTWLGVHEDETYELIKKISKKVLTQGELDQLEKKLRHNWVENIGNDDRFDETWHVVQDSAQYGFNASHANSVAWDSLYGAELKAHHPLLYFTSVFNVYKENTNKIAEITQELDYFNIQQKPIQFRYSQANYSNDEATNSIHKGIISLKYLNEKVSNELYNLKYEGYETFIDLLIDIKYKTSVNTRQMKILTLLDFFKEFGKSKKLIKTVEIFEEIHGRKQIKKADMEKLGISLELMQKHSQKETAKLFKELDIYKILKELELKIENKSISIKEKLQTELEYLGYAESAYKKAQKELYFVTKFKVYNSKAKPYLMLYQIKTGDTIKAKITKESLFIENNFQEGDIIQVNEFIKKPKNKLIDGEWVKSETEFDNIINSYDAY